MRGSAKDRISDLPESLLHHIHSFLEIKDSARTSILSTRWNYIWTTLPALCFHPDQTTLNSKIEKFMDFVDGTLHRHRLSSVDKFSLVCSWCHRLNESRLHSWICNVIQANVKELSLNLHQQHQIFVPLSLFTCESLISLNLKASIRPPKYISFPRLKRLSLCGPEFSSDSWNEELFTNSPALEELILEKCTIKTDSFCISIPTLKVLKISWMHWLTPPLGVLKIDAPRLVTFSYSGYVPKEFVSFSFLALMEADVRFLGFQFVIVKDNDVAAIMRFLRALGHVKCLTVNNIALQAVCSASNLLTNLLTFHNVKMLEVSDKPTTDQVLIAMLKAVPNLESLIFDEFFMDEEEDFSVDDSDDGESVGDADHEQDDSNFVEGEDNQGKQEDSSGDDDQEDDDCNFVEGEDNHGKADVGDVSDEDDNWALDLATTGCLFPHLKSVCFREFAGNQREIRWVKLILRNAKALKSMTIRHWWENGYRFVNEKSEEEVMKEIPSFPRASPDCVFEF